MQQYSEGKPIRIIPSKSVIASVMKNMNLDILHWIEYRPCLRKRPGHALGLIVLPVSVKKTSCTPGGHTQKD
jgi:hypothetical protein